MLNDTKSKSIAIIVLGVISIANILTRGTDTITIAIVGFIGGILVSKA